MVGKKTHQSKTHFYFSLKERVPEDNLYRQLREVIDWDFLYSVVSPHYGTCGHQSGPAAYDAFQDVYICSQGKVLKIKASKYIKATLTTPIVAVPVIVRTAPSKRNVVVRPIAKH